MSVIQTVSIAFALAGNAIALFVALIKIHMIANRVERTIDFFMLEHEILIQDYCERKGLEIKDLPTRLQPAWWRKAYGQQSR